MKLLKNAVFMLQLREKMDKCGDYANKMIEDCKIFEKLTPDKKYLKRSTSKERDGCNTKFDARSRLINVGHAKKLIERYSKRTFIHKEWTYENLHEVFWTILYQRPNLRKNIVNECKPVNKEYAAYWQRISTSNASIADVPRDIPMLTGSPLDDSIVSDGGSFLTFSKEMHELIFVNTSNLVNEMSVDITKRSEGPDGVTIAFDAEWSAYETGPPASILQISLDDVSYIVDVDVLPRDVIRPFVEMIFSHPKIHKLGFGYEEDLYELLKADSLKDCSSLIRPENISCILKLVVALKDESDKRPNAAEILKEFEVNVGPPRNESGRGRTFTPSLSSVCESLLGLPLDKREQCSVWTRRPLRALQLRYAAMDAFCLLLLHARCKKWAEKLGMPMEEITSISKGMGKGCCR